jgi:hypothetical protein
VDTCEHHTSDGSGPGSAYAALANRRRFFVLDAFLGRTAEAAAFPVDADPAGEALLAMAPGRIDVLGLDYYAHCQWHFGAEGGQVPTPHPTPLAGQITEYWERYRVPCLLSETNLRGFPSDRATWLKYVLEQCERARDAGVPLDGLCWFPFVDSADWDSLLYRCEGNIDPVGVYWLDERLDRRPSSMSRAFAMAATGTPAADLPAYHLQPPVSRWLAGYLPQMAHWDWREPPADEVARRDPRADDVDFELRVVG